MSEDKCYYEQKLGECCCHRDQYDYKYDRTTHNFKDEDVYSDKHQLKTMHSDTTQVWCVHCHKWWDNQ